jgi:2,3-bisphosphoglycerate-dependent phosphoglycerate mutase
MHYTAIIHSFSYFTDNIAGWIAAGGYTLLFLTVFLEAIPLLGTAVPGHVAVFMAGFLAKVGILNLWWVIAIAVVAAILGDFLGFYLGRRYGLSLIDRLKPYFFLTDDHLAKAQGLLAKHTGKAMIIGRMNPVTRALMPFLVGTGGTSIGKFWLFNILGGVIWAGGSILIGYALGFGYHAAAGYFGRAIVITVVAAVIIIWGYRFANLRFHVFRRYELFVLILNVLSLWALASMIRNALATVPKIDFDLWVYAFMSSHVGSFLGTTANIVTTIGGTAVTGGLAIVTGLFFAFRKKWRSAAIMIMSIGSTGILVSFMKDFFMVTRPLHGLVYIDPTDWSFPSGHAALAAAFFFVIAYLFAPKIKNWVARESFIVFCILAIIAIGLSRLILNVHWASDVIAGWSLGIFCATASILLVRYVGALLVKKSAINGGKAPANRYRLVLVRHGESVWNKENRFTGWVDVDLTEKGVEEAHKAGRELKGKGFTFDLAYTSVLKRAIKTLDIILKEMNEEDIEIKRSWKLNERHYGALQGLNKAETAAKYGEDQVKIWRRGYDVKIPPLTKDSPMYPGKDPLYKDLKESEIPLAENLKDVVEKRVVPYWNEEIAPEILKGRKIIISGTGNSLRGLIKHLENISDKDIVDLNIPTGIPLVYELDENLKPLKKYYLADPEELKKAIETVVNQGKAK